MHRHYIKSRPKCRKRVQLADTTTVEIIGQIQVTLTLEDGSSYQNQCDVLTGLTSSIVLSEGTLDKINAFTIHESSFADDFRRGATF